MRITLSSLSKYWHKACQFQGHLLRGKLPIYKYESKRTDCVFRSHLGTISFSVPLSDRILFFSVTRVISLVGGTRI